MLMTTNESLVSAVQFVQWFRSAAPYIRGFRGKTFVIVFGGEVIEDGSFVDLTHDLNLLASLGVRLVLVHGTRPQIEKMLASKQLETRYVNGIRVTDDSALQCVKEATGRLRVEIEALLSMGLANSPMANSKIRVASGNYVTARPIGVVEGVDLLYSGEVRKVDSEAIRVHLDNGEIVLLSPLGYSPTGEIFNLLVEDAATAAAVAIHADKLIFLTDVPGITDAKMQLQRELTVSQAEALLSQESELSTDIKLYLPFALKACRAHVARVHFVSRKLDGALLMELFSHDGIGTMITRDALECLRQATIDDIGGILNLIAPLEVEGVLVKRNREALEMEIDHFYVLVHDGVIIGCAALYPFLDAKSVELACLAVDPERRNVGAGERLLRHVENLSRKLGLQTLFVLTTRTEHWFVERGFSETGVDALPVHKQQLYNYQRRSKVFTKSL